MLKVLIADDHDIVIRGLKDLLNEEFQDIDYGVAQTKEEIYSQIENGEWDLILLDIVIPGLNGIDALNKIRESDSEVKVLMLTAVTEIEYAVRAISCGANGFITKQNATDELAKAVKKVLDGGTYLSAEAVEALAKSVQTKDEAPVHEQLSARELEVFCLLAKGRTVKQAAFDIGVSDKTVSTYVARIREKTGLTNFVDFARYALEHQLVD